MPLKDISSKTLCKYLVGSQCVQNTKGLKLSKFSISKKKQTNKQAKKKKLKPAQIIPKQIITVTTSLVVAD